MVDIKDNAVAPRPRLLCISGYKVTAAAYRGQSVGSGNHAADRLGINGMLGFCMACTICGFCVIQVITLQKEKGR
ncbi:MAG: hypothetical protein ACLUD2_12095 [Clostridium sp.]